MHSSRTKIQVINPKHNTTTRRESSHLPLYPHFRPLLQAERRTSINTVFTSKPIQVTQEFRQRTIVRTNPIPVSLVNHTPELAILFVSKLAIPSVTGSHENPLKTREKRHVPETNFGNIQAG